MDGYYLSDLPRNLVSSLTKADELNTDKVIMGFNSMDGLSGSVYVYNNKNNNKNKQKNNKLQQKT